MGIIKNRVTKLMLVISSVLILTSTYNIDIYASSKGDLGEFADEYEVEYDLGGVLDLGSVIATLKFNSADDIEFSGTLKFSTLATLIFDANPYRIVYEKGLSDDEWKATSSKPSPGYPKATEMFFDNESGQKFRSYYEDGKERLGRSYKIRFDSNDSLDNNGSTRSTLVKVTKTEVPVIESLDFKNTTRKKQFIADSKNATVSLSVNCYDGTSKTITTENLGFDGTLFFKHWSVVNTLENKTLYFDSLADIPAHANLSGEFGGKVVATAIWESRDFVYNKDFSDVSRPGYTFMGWLSLNQNKILNSGSPTLTVSPCIGNTANNYSNTNDYSSYRDVLVAQWKPKKYRVILNGNQPVGDVTTELLLVTFDSKIGDLPTPVISIPNTQYTFTGWYDAAVGGKLVDTESPYTFTHGMVIYAHWEINTHQTGEAPDVEPNLGTYDYLVPESQIVRAVELSANDYNLNILSDKYWLWHYQLNCPGHNYNGDTYFCSVIDSEMLQIENINFNNSSYKNFIAYVSPWSDFSYILERYKSTDDTIEDEHFELIPGIIETENNEDLLNSGDIKTKHNYNIAFHRGDDGLTLADWKNTSVNLSKITNLSKFNIADVSFNGRETNGHYTKVTTMKFRGQHNDAVVKQAIDGEPVCNDGGGSVTLNSGDFDKNITVTYKVYKGQSINTPNKTNTNPNNENLTNREVYQPLSIGTNSQYAMSGNRIPSGKYDSTTETLNELKIKFYPYIKMRYDTIDVNGNITIDNEVLVLGEYLREICFTDYAEVIYNKHKNYSSTDENFGFNLKVESSQWLNDASSKEFNNALDDSNVIPGGATLSLSSGKNIRQTIQVKTYQVTLTPEGKEQVEKTSGVTLDIPTYNDMKKAHLDYVESVILGLDNMEIVQYYYYNSDKENVKSIGNAWANGDFSIKRGIEVTPGLNMSNLDPEEGANTNLKTPLSTDSKYYLRDYKNLNPNSSEYAANKDRRNDLDVRVAVDIYGNEINLEAKRYTFRADVSGNLWASDGITDKIILTQDEDETKLTGIYKDINDRTLVISKIRDAIEYNTGNDNQATWVSDGNWYNEAFDGVEVYIFTSELETGIIDSNVRTTVFDPKLNTASNGNSTMFNEYAVNQFRIQDYLDTYGSGNKNQIALYKGSKVHMLDMDKLYISKPFYNSNVNVQDKH